MTALAPAAVLWDMDGTIVDTEPYWMAAETQLVSEYGGVWTHEDALTLVGSGLWHSARVLQSRGVTLDEDGIVRELTARVQAQLEIEVPWRPGARELIEEAAAAGVPVALVTMSIRTMAEQIAGHLPFSAIVAGDDVANPKPHPEAYLRAAQLLGVDVRECVAIEDSAPGVASAVASGAVVIAVPLHGTVPESGDHTDWGNLVGRSLADVSALYRAARAHV